MIPLGLVHLTSPSLFNDDNDSNKDDNDNNNDDNDNDND